MKLKYLSTLALAVFLCRTAVAVDYRVEPLGEAPPQGELSQEIVELLAPSGVRVIRGTSRTVCDMWLCKELAVKADFSPTFEVMYPFTPGQLIGAVRFARSSSDFRDQEINRGVYTLRYAQQPVDGAHVGTSLTRDFLLMIEAASDKSPGPLDYDTLIADSAEAAGTSHPCLLSLQKPQEGEENPAIRHDDRHDWWIVRLQGTTKAGEKLPVSLVVVGVGAE